MFWPVYRKYEAEVMKLNDQRLALIKSYGDEFVQSLMPTQRTYR